MGADALSDVLRAIRISGAIFFDITVRDPWVAATPTARECAPYVMPQAEHLMEYHVISEGSCWAGLIGGEFVEAREGDIVAFPQGDAHVLASAPGMWAEPSLEAYAVARSGRLPMTQSLGDAHGPQTRIVCGFLGCAARPFNPLLSALPRLIHDRAADRADVWLAEFSRLAVAESENRQAGGESVLERVSELMFISLVRRYLTSLPPEQTGWLAGLRDRHVGQALNLLHGRPAHSWTIDELARETGLSRSSLAERFTHFVGQPPIQYLTHWRIQMSTGLLTRGTESVARIAEAVGYESEAAFNRAFKKLVGAPPGEWRRTRAAAKAEMVGQG